MYFKDPQEVVETKTELKEREYWTHIHQVTQTRLHMKDQVITAGCGSTKLPTSSPCQLKRCQYCIRSSFLLPPSGQKISYCNFKKEVHWILMLCTPELIRGSEEGDSAEEGCEVFLEDFQALSRRSALTVLFWLEGMPSNPWKSRLWWNRRHSELWASTEMEESLQLRKLSPALTLSGQSLSSPRSYKQ